LKTTKLFPVHILFQTPSQTPPQLSSSHLVSPVFSAIMNWLIWYNRSCWHVIETPH
jgi:hypothetical protein